MASLKTSAAAPARTPSRRRAGLILAALGIALVGGVVAAVLWWQASGRSAVLEASVPEYVPGRVRTTEMEARIAACEARIRDGRDPVGALAELSRLYHANGYLDEAMQCYAGLAILDPSEPRWPYLHAVIHAGFGRAEEAAALLDVAVRLAPGHLPARLRQADGLLKLGRIAEARAAYTAILAAHPGEAYAVLGLARCDIDEEKWESARTHLERVVGMTQFALGYDLIVSVYERLGQHDRAAAIRGRMRAWGAYRDPIDPWMDELLEDCYDPYQLSLASGAAERRPDLPMALRLIERAVALAPDTAALHFQIGMLHLQRKNYGKAREHLERTTRLSPDFADGWAHLSGLLTTVGDRAGSERAVAQGLVHCPDSPGLHLMRARLHKRAGRTDEAIADMRTSIELRPTEADAYIELGMTLFGLERSGEAVEVLERALVAEPMHPLILTTLALHAVEDGDEAAARAWIAQCRLQPRVKAEDMDHVLQAFREKFPSSRP